MYLSYVLEFQFHYDLILLRQDDKEEICAAQFQFHYDLILFTGTVQKIPRGSLISISL